MKRSRRQGPRHRPRGVDPDDYEREMRLRAAVRGFLRDKWPDVPMPFGGDWLSAVCGARCPVCSSLVTLVSINGVDIPWLAYCATCDCGLIAEAAGV